MRIPLLVTTVVLVLLSLITSAPAAEPDGPSRAPPGPQPVAHDPTEVDEAKLTIKRSDEAIAADADNLEALLNRADARQLLGEHGSAIADFDEAIQLVKQFEAELYARRAAARMSQKEYGEAIGDFDRSLASWPGINVYNDRGTAWASLGDYERALADYSTAIRFDPASAEAYQNRGLVWQYRGEWSNAIADFDKAIEIAPEFVSAYYNRGNTWADQDQHEKAIADFDRAIALEPQAAIYHNRGYSFESLGKLDEAIADYEVAIQLRPEFARTHADRGRAQVMDAEAEGEFALLQATAGATAAAASELRKMSTMSTGRPMSFSDPTNGFPIRLLPT